MRKVKLAIFGTGSFYKKEKEKLDAISNVEICAFIDNDKHLWGKTLQGILIRPPVDLDKVEYDYIVLMSLYATEMYEQLINMRVEQSKILYWGNFKAKFSKSIKRYCVNDNECGTKKEQILIITTDINYNGGTMAAIYAAISLQSKNYKVDLFAPTGNANLIQEINEYGIDVTIYDSLPYIKKEKWIKKYKVVIVNVLQMIQCAVEISEYRPVLWWIHEPRIMYSTVLKQFSNYANVKKLKYVNSYAVSSMAKRNFNCYFPNKIRGILNYGIPDNEILDKQVRSEKKFVFAMIGNICEIKAQDIFIQAVNQISDIDLIEFWIIGHLSSSAYGCAIVKIAESNSKIKILGVLSRNEIYEKFREINVVVCPSREDSLPIVMTEAMMFRKVCIVSERTGTADYIVDGENGFIIEADNVGMLKDKMQWTVEHRDKLEVIGNKARKTYEKYFSMAIFSKNLEKAINETINEWTIKG